MIILNDDDIETYTTSITENELVCYKCDDDDKFVKIILECFVGVASDYKKNSQLLDKHV